MQKYFYDLGMDPREALLRYESKPTSKEIDHFTRVFQKNQPEKLFAKRTLEADMDEENKRRKKMLSSIPK